MEKKIEEYVNFYDGLSFDVADFKKLNFNFRRDIAANFNNNAKYLHSNINLSGENGYNHNWQKLMFSNKYQTVLDDLIVKNLDDIDKFISVLNSEKLMVFITEVLAYVRLGVFLVDFDESESDSLVLNEEEMTITNPNRLKELLSIVKIRESKWKNIIDELKITANEFIKSEFKDNKYVHIVDDKLQLSTQLFVDIGYGKPENFDKYIELENYLSKSIISESVNIRLKTVWSTIYHGNIDVLDVLITELEKIFVHFVLDVFEIDNLNFWKGERYELYNEYFSLYHAIKKIKTEKENEIF